MTTITELQLRAQQLVDEAEALGFNITVNQRPSLPLAMTHYESMVQVWERRPPAVTLWALHVPGPDDLLAAPSREEAVRVAAIFNPTMESFQAKTWSRYSPPAGASLAHVVPWPGTADEHAAALADWNPADWGA